MGTTATLNGTTLQVQAIKGDKGDPITGETGPAGKDATNLIHVTDGQGATVEVSNPTILSFQKCIGAERVFGATPTAGNVQSTR